MTTSVTANSDVMTLALDAAQQWMDREASRQFVPGSAGVTRYFDGSGTGELVVDDYIDVASVKIVGYPSVPYLDVTGFVEVTRNGYANDTLHIVRGAPNLGLGYIDAFFRGRSNIEVVAQWGYGANVPAPVWKAMRDLAAAEVAAMARYGTAGLLKSWREGDVNEDYDVSGLPGEALGWLQSAAKVAASYRKRGTAKRANANLRRLVV